MFVLHWSQYTCGRFALPQSRHRCTSVTKSMRLNWFRRLRRDGVTLRLGTAMSANGHPGWPRRPPRPSGAREPRTRARPTPTPDGGAPSADRSSRPPCSPTRRRWGGSTCGSSVPSKEGERSRTRRRRARRVASRRASSHCAHTSARADPNLPPSRREEVGSDCALSSGE